MAVASKCPKRKLLTVLCPRGIVWENIQLVESWVNVFKLKVGERFCGFWLLKFALV